MNLLESFSGVTELNMLLWWSWFAFILSQLCFFAIKGYVVVVVVVVVVCFFAILMKMLTAVQ